MTRISIKVSDKNLRARRVREALAKANTTCDIAWRNKSDRKEVMTALQALDELSAVVADYTDLIGGYVRAM